jgi:hypothetical protein
MHSHISSIEWNREKAKKFIDFVIELSTDLINLRNIAKSKVCKNVRFPAKNMQQINISLAFKDIFPNGIIFDLSYNMLIANRQNHFEMHLCNDYININYECKILSEEYLFFIETLEEKNACAYIDISEYINELILNASRMGFNDLLESLRTDSENYYNSLYQCIQNFANEDPKVFMSNANYRSLCNILYSHIRNISQIGNDMVERIKNSFKNNDTEMIIKILR